MQRLTLEQRAFIDKARHPGTSEMGVALSDGDCAFLLAVIAADLGLDLPALPPVGEYFEAPPVSLEADPGVDLDDAFARLFAYEDADTYFACLAALHQARLKYHRVVAFQPMPSMDQVGPRGLLQYGTMPSRALVSWLAWRKWLYDVDNRAAQDTGYLFEPIIVAAIRGEGFSAKKSPIRRRGDASRGRQVDCIRGRSAYEFKIRLTIAASGQGRWGEEIEFAHDAAASGYRPILMVFDPTPNPKLAQIVDAFEGVGGHAFIGEDAWRHLEEEAGEVMGRFLDKYMRVPLAALFEAHADVARPDDLALRARPDHLAFELGATSVTTPRPSSRPKKKRVKRSR